jgi:two-component system CheB/CheR fusion protein
VVRENIQVEVDDRVQCVNLNIDPFNSDDGEPMFVVIFNDVGQPHDHEGDVASDRNAGLHERLELELRNTRERLQATIEEYETAVEELKSSNEELQSINEELQSANEELETSKEELQSLNEELNTVNTELNSKVDELDRAHNDLRSLFDSTQIATVFLDQDLMIRSFTPAMNKLFNLIASDRGRPLTDIVSRIDNNELRGEIDKVFRTGESLEKYVTARDSHTHYLMRIIPYRRVKNEIEGVLVTFIDVTNIKESETRQRILIDELNHRVRNMLTVVCAVARQSASRSDGSKQDFTDAFIGRVQAMSTTYTLVSSEQWSDVEVGLLVGEHLAPYQSDSRPRFSIEGPRILCKPNVAVALGLVFHELATNAAKYGALSAAQGTVSVQWHVEPGTPEKLVLNWREVGGPKITKPTHQGFGTSLIERELQYALHGALRFTFEPDGLQLQMEIPLDHSRLFRPEAPYG